MRKLAFLVPFAAAAAVAASVHAQPTGVSVTLDPAFQDKAEELGLPEVREQMDRLGDIVHRALADDPALTGARVELVVTDLKPNRPTMEQMRDRPGLDPIQSISIGGAAIEGRIVTADGAVQPVRYRWFTNNLADVHAAGVWSDAERAYRRLAANLEAGRYAQR